MSGPRFLPSAEQIRQACEEIRATWSEAQHRFRATGLTAEEAKEKPDWLPPECSLPPTDRRGTD